LPVRGSAAIVLGIVTQSMSGPAQAAPPRQGPRLPPTVQPVRATVWVLHLALPVAGLWLLLAQPALDVEWHDNPSHFWLVAVVATVNLALGARMSAAARRHADARLFGVSLVFLASAGFFLLHALATPGMLIDHPNAGFDLAQPVGLALAALFAVGSSLELDRAGAAVLRARYVCWIGLAVLLAAWAAASLADTPLNHPTSPDSVAGPLIVVTAVAVAAYLIAAVRYYLVHRRRPAAMLLSLITAFTLLAEAMVAVTVTDNWHLSWWLWHLLLVLAFGFVAYSAHVQYRREGSSAGIFDAITLAETTRQIRAEYSAALEELVAALEERERTGSVAEPLAARVAERFDLTEGQTAVLDRAGRALSAERTMSRRLGALVAVGEQARIGMDEEEFLRTTLAAVRPAFGDVHLGLAADGVATVDGRRYTAADFDGAAGHALGRDGRNAFALTVKGRFAGVLEVPLAVPLDATLASQVSLTLENARLYRELGTLFRQYLSPDVAAALLADPDQAALGGSLVEVTALFADLRGFTTFSEAVEPGEIVTMLNRYHGAAVPCILDNGGTIVQFVGDALLALFNAPARQPDHATRAVRAALDMQEAVARIAAERRDWPRFRIGANTGPALVGNIGSEALRGFNAMGDAVNVAARLQGLAEPGQVVIGEATRDAVGDAATVEPLGELTVKGRQAPVRAFVVTGLGTA
jgi:class 3 adenylate cyclase